ncbi:MAG: methyltransferase domain-containing protein [Clostridia bacterium]|nr:methyltransferase domain-containing protein [Clostridia bacterium]
MDKAVNVKREPIGNGRFIYVSDEHTFGTDAVLLADFAKPKRNDIAVDLGTGCGIIPFLMLRDGKIKEAFGVDIAPAATELAEMTASKENFDNFTAVLSDIAELKGKISFGDKTLVTCNPPYKAANAGIKAEKSARLIARFESTCTLEDTVRVGAALLRTGGRLCMCQRPERLAELITLMSKHGVEPKRLRTVAKAVGEAPWLILIEGKRDAKPGLVIEPELYIYKDGELSEEMKRIYGPYKEAYRGVG